MSTLTYLSGRPVYDWEIILQNILANGTFSAPTGGGTGLSLAFGSLRFDLIGTGFAVAGPRTVSAGFITGFSIVDNGQTVLTMSGLTLPTFSDLQTMVTGSIGVDPYGETFKTLFAPFFMNEAVTATGTGDGESIFGSNDVDQINAGGGDDYVRAGNGVDFLDGGTGWDFLDYSGDVRTVGININLSTNAVLNNNVGAAIVDSISSFEGIGGTGFADILRGDDGNNVLIGNGGGDTFYGMGGDNFYRGDSGVDTFIGGAGTGDGQWDKVSYEGETGGSGIVATFSNGNVSVVDTYGFTDTGTNIEEVKGSRYADTFNGDSGDNSAEGMGGADTFNMGGGTDQIEYQHEVDAGTTQGVIVNLSANAISATLNNGLEIVQAGHARDSFGATDTLNSVEYVFGTRYNDYIVGNPVDNSLNGFDGDDTLDGGAGSDALIGGAGNDRIIYDAADEAANVTGDADTDTLVVVGGSLPISFNLVASSFEQAEWQQTDNAGQSWSTILGRYNSDWQITSSSTILDTGMDREMLYDYTSAITWQSRQLDYAAPSAGSALTYDYLTFDDLSSRDTSYDTDLATAYKSIRNDYNAAGDRTYLYFVFEDNSGRDTTLDYTTDTVWQSIRNDYNTAGQKTYIFYNFDNGPQRDVSLDYGTGQIWQSLTQNYDATAQHKLTDQYFIFDDNTARYVEFGTFAGHPGATQHITNYADAAGTIYLNDFYV
jgi:Ca2+-binding RTX toxin-like protein